MELIPLLLHQTIAELQEEHKQLKEGTDESKKKNESLFNYNVSLIEAVLVSEKN